MAYKRVGWTNNGGEPLNSTNLEHIEEGIEHCVCKDSDAENIMQSPIELRNLTLGNLENENEAISKKYLDAYIDNYVKTRKDNTWRDYSCDLTPNTWNSFNIDGDFTYFIIWSAIINRSNVECTGISVDYNYGESKFVSPSGFECYIPIANYGYGRCNIIKIENYTRDDDDSRSCDFRIRTDYGASGCDVYIRRLDNTIKFYCDYTSTIYFSVI